MLRAATAGNLVARDVFKNTAPVVFRRFAGWPKACKTGLMLLPFAVGSMVRLVAIPPGLPDDDDLPTQRLFVACLGGVFPVAAIVGHLIELEVGSVLGERAAMHSIYVEPEFLAPAEP